MLLSIVVVVLVALIGPFARIASAGMPRDCGVRVHIRDRTIDIPGIAGPGSIVGCMTVLPATTRAPQGTLVCRVGSNWLGKRVGPASDPDDHSADCLLFIDLETGGWTRYGGLQPAPNFVVQSANGEYFALGSSVGWSFTERSRRNFLDINEGRTYYASELSGKGVKDRVIAALTGTVLYSVWDSATMRPLWEMRFPQNGATAATETFTRPWEQSDRIAIPWWAIEEAPQLYRFPVMGFSPTGRYFVALNDTFGVHILDVDKGHQSYVAKPSKQCRPVTFMFSNTDTMIVMRSDSTTLRVRLADGRVLEESRWDTAVYPPHESYGGHTYPAFCSDPSRCWVLMVSRDVLKMQRLLPPEQSSFAVQLSVGGTPIGVSRVELSKNGRWAGVQIETPHETVVGMRYQDSGYTSRFERIDLESQRVVERVANPRAAERHLLADSVPTVNLSSRRIRTFGACLSARGDEIIYAIPIRSP